MHADAVTVGAADLVSADAASVGAGELVSVLVGMTLLQPWGRARAS